MFYIMKLTFNLSLTKFRDNIEYFNEYLEKKMYIYIHIYIYIYIYILTFNQSISFKK